MAHRFSRGMIEQLESRWMLTWASYATLVDQDQAAADYSSITGKGVTVAVIDTGIDYTQPSLGGGIGKSFKVIGGYDFVDNDSDPMDESGHGTSVAGVIAANPYTVDGITYQGVAPAAKLVALRVGTEDSIPDANIDKALKWVITNYKTYDISVINLSLGSGNFTSAETEAPLSADFAQLNKLGIFVVAASGNSNDQQSGPISQDGIAFPAADPNVFAVGAVDSNDVITTWSQRGSELDLLAPGVNIVMPQLGGGFVTEDGTSFASPYVAGTAALIKQADSAVKPGDIGSILMASGTSNRDGDKETGNTTGLLFSRLNIDGALSLTAQRVGETATLQTGSVFDTALDSNGVLYAVYYDTKNRDLDFATRDIDGLWSTPRKIDSAGDVGAQLSIAIDTSGKAGVAYFDSTNTAIKYADFTGSRWSDVTVDSDKNVGTSPSIAYDIDGNAYLGYYRRSSGDLRLATLDRDAGTWTLKTIDGADGTDVGSDVSIDVGEAAVASNFGFTTYDTTVALAYSDSTNGNLKYARLDLDDPSATWFISVVDDLNGVNNIHLKLHATATSSALQAQIAYQDIQNDDVKYAYRNTNWFPETVYSHGTVGDSVQLAFDSSNDPTVTFYSSTKRAIYIATRSIAGAWTTQFDSVSSLPVSVGYNDRTGDSILSVLDRSHTSLISSVLT
jgi:subtilisin family serine protease